MLSDNWDILVILAVVGSLSLGGPFYLGRRWERHIWNKAVPHQMEGLCEECQTAGLWMGYKKGREAGLKTCDDVLANIDDGGHR